MAIKKYQFSKLLDEYNKIYGHNDYLPSRLSNATVIHDIGINKFYVIYIDVDSTVKNKQSLEEFIYFHISVHTEWHNIRDIILSKEEEKLNLKIEIWPPSKIRHAYLSSNYFARDVGNLGKSCMRKKDMQKALNFYVKNKVRIVVVIDDKNKIHARALLWDGVQSTKLKKPFTYLDRIYANTDTLCPLFHAIAKENKWKYYPTTIVNNMNKTYYKKDIIIADMCHLPFMDTFRYLYSKDNLLTSSSRFEHGTNYIVLEQHTNCGYYPELDSDRTQEAFTGSYISKKDAVLIKRYENNYDGFVLRKNIANINGVYYSIYDKTIVRIKCAKYILKENSINEIITNDVIDKTTATFSEKYNGYIYKSNVIKIKDEIYHKKDADVICFRDKWYHTSQCLINYDREKRNIALSKRKFHFWIEDEVFVPYPDDFVVRKGNLIPKECAIIAYDLIYNPVLDSIEYQEVYCTDMVGLRQLVTGEWVVSSSKNKEYLKKFNNKWYIKQDFKLPNKKQLQFAFMDKEK